MPEMDTVRQRLGSSLGKKVMMAITGLGLYGFVIGHMLGNLQVFLGPEPLNAYAAYLQSKPEWLWLARIGLLLMAGIHTLTAVQLTRENRAARPIGYARQHPMGASLASRTMMLSGLVVAAFIIYHLLHFTLGVTNPEYLDLRDSAGRPDVYRMTVLGFSHPGVSAFYVVSVGLLCLHLSHGFSSLFQSLGANQRKYAVLFGRISRTAAVVIFIGNSSMPMAVLSGLIE